jgi:hypothetical protein
MGTQTEAKTRSSRQPKIMKRHPAGSLPTEVIPQATPVAATSGDSGAEKKWQVDRASGVPAPVIRTNMVSLRLSRKGQLKVAFFEQG